MDRSAAAGVYSSMRMRRALLGLALFLAACASSEEAEQQLDQPLTPVLIRRAFIGRTLIGGPDASPIYIYFAPNGVLVRNNHVAEYGQWRVDETQGLCLIWHETEADCSPVYQIHTGRYRFGGAEYNLSPGPLGAARFGRRFGLEER
ncbi:MAG: hypothetical protein JO255_22015 [Alphaproteobacteria bacterium]|nr:hypothetical protein [Alphaproteobacteria bacterium]